MNGDRCFVLSHAREGRKAMSGKKVMYKCLFDLELVWLCWEGE
jgi:hypothetical protein